MPQGKGYIDFQKVKVNVSSVHGLLLKENDNIVDIKYSNLFVRGKTFQGMCFWGWNSLTRCVQ